MTLEELRVQRLIQGILVRSYVDTSRLDVTVIGSSVYVEGELKMFEYYPGRKKTDPTERDLDVKRNLLHIEQQIRSIAEVTSVDFKLSNWQRVGIAWIPRHRGATV
jgi:hypothetical protein